jgi:hypothetical protein
MIQDKRYLNKRGLYLYSAAAELRYIGRCRDTFKKRINQGHGKIHPKNCYIDGQATNCHLNALITEQREGVRLWVYPMEDNSLIEEIERELIEYHSPLWNIALKLR